MSHLSNKRVTGIITVIQFRIIMIFLKSKINITCTSKVNCFHLRRTFNSFYYNYSFVISVSLGKKEENHMCNIDCPVPLLCHSLRRSLQYKTRLFPHKQHTRNTLTQASKNRRKHYLFPQRKFVSVFYAIYTFNTIYYFKPTNFN